MAEDIVKRSDEPIDPCDIAYMRARNRNRVYDTVLREFMRADVSKALLARRLRKRPELVSRLLGAPGNWTLDTVSDFLLAISGAELTYSIARPTDQPRRNCDGVKERDECAWRNLP